MFQFESNIQKLFLKFTLLSCFNAPLYMVGVLNTLTDIILSQLVDWIVKWFMVFYAFLPNIFTVSDDDDDDDDDDVYNLCLASILC